MAWFDGTFNITQWELEREFPYRVTGNLRMSEDKHKLCIINDFREGSLYGSLSDPKAELDGPEAGEYVFYHIFTGRDACAARDAVFDFAHNHWDREDGLSITLIRKDKDHMFQYAYGSICMDKLHKQSDLKYELADWDDLNKSVFVLPLRRYFFRCDCCHQRTLLYHGYFLICHECGWEDEGIKYTYRTARLGGMPNGDSLVDYRRKYHMLKAANPDYSWKKR